MTSVSVTLNHIFSCCSPSLEKGRFSFRHDNYISKCLYKQRFPWLRGSTHSSRGNHYFNSCCYCEETRHSHCLPRSIFELTIPCETRLDTAHKQKTEAYSHFFRDITSHTVTVTPFEEGAHTGHINNDNKKRLKKLHSFCTKDIKLKKFKENISEFPY